MRHLIAFSGGKDSQATIIWALNNLEEPFDIVFCDTAWESEETYKFMLDFEAKLQQPIHFLKSKKYKSLMHMATVKNRFPSMHARFCTDELKIKPMVDFILDVIQEDCTIYQGIRHEESRNRAGMEKRDDYFKGYTHPYKIVDLREKKQGLIEELDKKGDTMKPKRRLSILKKIASIDKDIKKGKLTEESFYSYRRKDVLNFCKKYEANVVRPIITWTTQQVFDYITANGFEYNPLYKKGAKRVGCYPCVMCSHGEIEQIAKHDPERIDEIRKKEQELGLTFFPSGYIPSQHCTKQVSSNTGLKYVPTIDDVVRYVQKGNTVELPTSSCKNTFLPCE